MSQLEQNENRLVVRDGAAVQHLDGANDIGGLQQVPAGIRLLRASTHRHRINVILGQVEFPKGTEHICQILVSRDSPVSPECPTYLRL